MYLVTYPTIDYLTHWQIHMLKRIKQWFQKPNEPSKFDTAITALSSIQTNQLSRMYSSDMSLSTVSVFYPNIVAYLEALNRINSAFENHTLLAPYAIKGELRDVYVSEFFLDKSGKYFDSVALIGDEFIAAACQCLVLYQECERLSVNDDSDPRIVRTLQISHQVVVNVMSLADTIHVFLNEHVHN